MKTSIEIPETLFRQTKARAAMEGLSLPGFILARSAVILDIVHILG